MKETELFEALCKEVGISLDMAEYKEEYNLYRGCLVVSETYVIFKKARAPLLAEIERLNLNLNKQAKAALSAIDNAKAMGMTALRKEREANARLTAEIERLNRIIEGRTA